MEKRLIEYVTKSGNRYPIELMWKSVPCDAVPYDKQLTQEACENGCRLFGRNGGCPPHAPDFSLLKNKYEGAVLVLAKLKTSDYPIRVLNGPYYVKWVFVETTISRLLTNFGKQINSIGDAFFLNSGHCVGCGNKKCNFKLGEKKCVNPLSRTYSLEATGILVTKAVENEFGFPLYWWNKNDLRYLPPYMCKIVGVLYKNRDALNRINGAVEDFFV